MIKIHLFDAAPFFDTPYQLMGWIGWFVMAALILWIVRQDLTRQRPIQFWKQFFVLGLITIIGTLFFGFDLPLNSKVPLPNIPGEIQSPTVMVFMMVPILLSGGMLGVWPAAVLGFVAGIFSALWNTHSVFTPLEISALAVVLTLAMRQNYRTRFFAFMRKPIGAAVMAVFLSIPLFLVSTFFGTNGNLAAKLDYAFTRSWVLIGVSAIQLLFAGLICEALRVRRSRYWVKFDSFEPSPLETGLQNRILYIALPLVGVLLMTLVIADWIVAGRAARDILVTQLKDSARIAAENIPPILETGQSLTTALVDQKLPLNDTKQLRKILQGKIRELPFFSQIFVFDLTGAPLTGYPDNDIGEFRLSSEEEMGIQLALNGVQIQNYVIQPNPGAESALITYVAAIPDEYGLAQGVIIARTDLTMNLFSQPALLALQNLAEAGGQGAIIDETNRVLYHTNPNLIMTVYAGQIPAVSGYFEDPGLMGTRYMNYATVDDGNGWKVILSMPASYSQQLALRIAVPLLVISLVISVLAYLLLRYLIKTLTKSLVHLANKADEISKGELDNRVEVRGVDEIGRLSSAFEQMRVSLKSRLEELDALLKVSQGIASDLSLESTSAHLLSALRSYGADAASLVLTRGTKQGWDEGLETYRSGEEAEEYAYLDHLLLEQVQEEPILIIPSRARIRRMGLPKTAAIPSALAAIALNKSGENPGFIWVVYTQSHRFLEPEIRFLNTLAGQALLAVSNSLLYQRAEVGKKRLESILTSTPEPVLVAGESGQLLMVNQAAEEMTLLIRLNAQANTGKGEIISKTLKEFITGTNPTESRAEEMELEDHHIYLVSVSPVAVESQHLGKVCVLRDVTDYKQLEKMKSEYVSTVSHDLKAPLILIRGYASMLPMVGELNDQQRDYSQKILDGIDDISRMADNLLDMRRIDSGIQLQVERVSPSDLLDEVIEEMQPQIKHRKIQILRELTLAQNLTIEADRVLLQRALHNLLDNAVKFSPLGSQVNLRLQVNENSVVFEIQDHGPGIAPLDQPHVFESVRRNTDGTLKKEWGVGLSIVRSIAERHQGRAWLESQLGKGSTFFLEIPSHYQATGTKKSQEI